MYLDMLNKNEWTKINLASQKGIVFFLPLISACNCSNAVLTGCQGGQFFTNFNGSWACVDCPSGH